MANVFFNLPAPAGNGAGAAVDVSSMGALKTITVGSVAGVFQPFVAIEFSCDSGQAIWQALEMFQAPGEKTVSVACLYLRAVVSNYRGGGAPNCDCGGEDLGTTGAALAATSGNGTAAATDITALPTFKTVQVGGAFRGAVNIEISEDGTDYETITSFQKPGFFTNAFAASHMRVVRSGVPTNTPGLPIARVCGAAEGGGGGSGSYDPPYVDLRLAPYNLVADDSDPAVADANTAAVNQAITDWTGTGASLAFPQGDIYLGQDGADNWSMRLGPGISDLTFTGWGMFATRLIQNGAGDGGDWTLFVLDGAKRIEFRDLHMEQGTIDNPDPGQQNHLLSIVNTTGVSSSEIDCHDLSFGKCLGDAFRVVAVGPTDVVENIKLLNFIMLLDGIVNVPSGRFGARCGVAVQRGCRNVEIGMFYIYGAQNSPFDCEPTANGISDGLYVHDGVADNTAGNTGTCGSYGGSSGGGVTATNMVLRNVQHIGGKVIIASTIGAILDQVTVFTDAPMPADPGEPLLLIRQNNAGIQLIDCTVQRVGTSGAGNCCDIENTGTGTRIQGGLYELAVSGDPIVTDGCNNLTVLGPEIRYSGPVPEAHAGLTVNSIIGTVNDLVVDNLKVTCSSAARLQAGVLLQSRGPNSMQRIRVSNLKVFGNGAFYGVLYSVGVGATFDANPLFQGIEVGGAIPQVWRSENAGGAEIFTVFPITSGNRGLLTARRLEGNITPNGNCVGNLGDIYTWRPTTTSSAIYFKATEAVAGVPDNVGWQLVGGGSGGVTLTPAALAAGTTQNYAPTNLVSATFLRLATDAANSALGGLLATGVSDGQEIRVVNLGPGTLQLNASDAGSAAANQFALEGGANRLIGVNGTVIVKRDATLTKWLCIG